MTDKHVVQEVAELAAADGHRETRGYSGRGMYGAECLAVDYEGNLLAAVAELVQAARDLGHPEGSRGERALDALQEALSGARTDQMGRGGVLYFPGVPYVRDDPKVRAPEDAS